ncbi:MAG: hypothetical protein PHX49_01395 [Bacteroidales bacterium]|nr:hypothetical protein [Bacteroidales bacterium]
MVFLNVEGCFFISFFPQERNEAKKELPLHFSPGSDRLLCCDNPKLASLKQGVATVANLPLATYPARK